MSLSRARRARLMTALKPTLIIPSKKGAHGAPWAIAFLLNVLKLSFSAA